MSSNHLKLGFPLLLPSIFPSIRVFSNELALCIGWPKYWSFSISPSSEYAGLISFWIDWLDLLVVQRTQESSLASQLKASILWCLTCFKVHSQHLYMPTVPLLLAMKWWDWMPRSSFLWILSLKQAFFLFSFTLIKRFFSFSLLSVIRVVSSAYLRLLIFLLAILIPTCDSSSLPFCMIYSAEKLDKKGENMLPCYTLFPILNQSIVPCLVLAVASCIKNLRVFSQLYFLGL